MCGGEKQSAFRSALPRRVFSQRSQPLSARDERERAAASSSLLHTKFAIWYAAGPEALSSIIPNVKPENYRTIVCWCVCETNTMRRTGGNTHTWLWKKRDPRWKNPRLGRNLRLENFKLCSERAQVTQPSGSCGSDGQTKTQCERCYECSFFNTSSELIILLKFLNVCMGIIAANVK